LRRVHVKQLKGNHTGSPKRGRRKRWRRDSSAWKAKDILARPIKKLPLQKSKKAIWRNTTQGPDHPLWGVQEGEKLYKTWEGSALRKPKWGCLKLREGTISRG